MKTLRSLLSLLCMAILLGSSQQLEAHSSQQFSPIRQMRWTIWCDFSSIDITNLSQEELNQTFTAMFGDLHKCCPRHRIRRVIVRIIDPSSCDFFHPKRFNLNQNNNVVYWLHKLCSAGIECEAVFDGSPFHCDSRSLFGEFQELFTNLLDFNKPLGNFFNLIEKLKWISLANDFYQGASSQGPLIKGITINPQGENEEACQEIVNTVDKYRHNSDPDLLPPNQWEGLRTAMVCHPDQKDFALANMTPYPLHQHLQSMDQGNLGISLPKNHPAKAPHYLEPEWRYVQWARGDLSQRGPLLETVYIFWDSPHLTEKICHPPQDKTREKDIERSAQHVLSLFQGKHFVKGPGRLSIDGDSSTVRGNATLFLSGRSDRTGKVHKGSYIQLFPPNTAHPILRRVIEDPEDEWSAEIDAPIGREEIENAEYYVSYGDDWSNVKVSSPLVDGIYLCFETNPSCFGSWDLREFMALLYHRARKGVFNTPLFLLLHGGKRVPFSDNVVIRDFTQIPNGTPPNEQYDWGLGNHGRSHGIICAY